VYEEAEAELSFAPVIKDERSFDLERRLRSPFYENIAREGCQPPGHPQELLGIPGQGAQADDGRIAEAQEGEPRLSMPPPFLTSRAGRHGSSPRTRTDRDLARGNQRIQVHTERELDPSQRST
jgi:hypothetical protein